MDSNNADSQTLKLLFTQNPDVPSLALTPKFILVPTLIHGLFYVAIKINK